MHAMLIDENRNLKWSEVPNPTLEPGKVIIEIYAAGINRADLLQRAGTYPSPKGWPEWMGLEVSGVISEVGEGVTRWKVGDKVCALLGGGGYAEYVAVPEEMVMPIPQGLSFEEAASLPEAYATCFLNLFTEGEYKTGETLFFTAGSSGLASVGIPMAKAVGAYVITTVRNEIKAEKIKNLNADVVIDLSKEKASDALKREAENGHPVDVAIDCLGGENIGESFPYVNESCRWVLIATLAGTETKIPLRYVLNKGIIFKGSTLRKRTSEEKGRILNELVEKIWPKLESKEMKPSIYKVLPLTEAEEAHRILQNGEQVGKVVLKVK